MKTTQYKKWNRGMFTHSKKAFSPGRLIKITTETSEEETDNRSEALFSRGWIAECRTLIYLPVQG